MEMSHALVLAGVLALGIFLGAWVVSAWRRMRERKRAREYNQRGQRAERRAAELLEVEGYSIVARQLRTTYSVELEGATQEVPLIVDFVVQRRGERFAAEVKTGASATGLEHAETRRQLLEYQLALGSNRVLLVDPEHRKITTVAFPLLHQAPAATTGPHRLPLIGVAAAILLLGAAAAWLASREEAAPIEHRSD